MSASDLGAMMKDLNISEEEVKRMTQAFENPQFKELFLDYVKEIENPDNKAKYEEEIRQMERERGIEAKFIHPTPKECLHTKEHILQMNAFVNIATNDLVDEAKCLRDEKKRGFNWTLPHSMTPPREDMFDGGKCKIYDVIFHPNTYRMGESNENFMGMLRETAIDAIRKSWNIVLDKKFEILKDQQYFGKIESTILRSKGTQQVKEAEIQDPRSDVALRQDLEKWMQEKRAKTKSRITGSRKPEQIQPETGIIQPEYEIKQSKNVNMQDYVGNNCQAPNRPDNLIITIQLPKLQNSKNIKLDVQDRSLTLKTENEEPSYSLKVELPYQIDSSNGANAKYKKEQKTLEVTLPVVIDKTADSLYIPQMLLPEIKKDIPKDIKSDNERIKNEPRVRNLVELIPAHNLTLPDFKASESERWCLFEVSVGLEVPCECKITPSGFIITSKYEKGKDQIGIAISLGVEGVEMMESNKITTDGFFEIKLRKSKPGLLKHYWMGKTQHCMEDYRFDALISDRQVEGDRSLTTPNEPAIWVPTKTDSKDTPRVVAKASKKSKK